MRIARHERECPHRHLFQFYGVDATGRENWATSRWLGITFYEGKGFRTFKDPKPSCESKIAELVQSYPIKSCSVISHIRQANRGGVSLENTHPFTRELWGRYWTFAHNGQLSDYHTLDSGRHRPVGQTDSEKAFCWLLNQLEQRYPEIPQDMESVFTYLASCCEVLKEKECLTC